MGKFGGSSKKLISIVVQDFHIKRLFPDFKSTLQHSEATWVGGLRPTSLSEKYQIKIFYKLESFPKIWVISPELKLRPGANIIPHTYPSKRLCLFLPKAGEWRGDMLIALTIIPWASLWLYYYEIWYLTGEWLGGGIHPSVKDPDD